MKYFTQIHCNILKDIKDPLIMDIYIDLSDVFARYNNRSLIHIETETSPIGQVKLRNNKNIVSSKLISNLEDNLIHFSNIIRLSQISGLNGTDYDIYTHIPQGTDTNPTVSYYYYFDIDKDTLNTMIEEYPIQRVPLYGVSFISQDSKGTFFYFSKPPKSNKDKIDIKRVYYPNIIGSANLKTPWEQNIHTIINKVINNPKYSENVVYPISFSLKDICDISKCDMEYIKMCRGI